jgi:hypothetical protein
MYLSLVAVLLLANALPAQNISVSRGIGIVEDDGGSYWPGFPANFQAPATFKLTPTASNTYNVERVPFAFDDPSSGVAILDGAKRPIVGFVDANYVPYNLPAPYTFGGKQYTKLNVSTWGAIAFGDADSTQVNYDPTVVSSMFHIPIAAVWYELFYYPSDARIIAKAKAHSVVITWQNVSSRHSSTRCTFQAEVFDSGALQFSYQTLPVDHALVGVNTGTETPARTTANGLTGLNIPPHFQVSKATFDDYGGVTAEVTINVNATIPAPDKTLVEWYDYMLLINGVEVAGVMIDRNSGPSFYRPAAKIPEFPQAQINAWYMTVSGSTVSFRVPTSSLEPYLNPSGINTWSIKSKRISNAGNIDMVVTEIAPLNLTVRHSLLPSDGSVEIPAQVFHYMPGIWDTDRIRESISAYTAGHKVDSFRFFPTTYDESMKHTNFAATYPRISSVTGIGLVPSRPECDCHYGEELSSVSESLDDETTTQVALTHELGHECVFYANFVDTDGTVKGAWRDAGIPCTGGAHPSNGLVNPSMFADQTSSAPTMSVMGGSLTGTYQVNTPRFGFSPVEMYFMGLAASSEVPPVTFLNNGVKQQITIDRVIAANGVRTPSWTGAMRVFIVPTFVVKRKGETIDDAQLQTLQSLMARWQSRFWRETGGRARANIAADWGCSYTLSATNALVAAAAGTASVRIFGDAGCSWTATTSEAWITVTSGSGSGDGKVSYSVATNPSSASRSGTITVGGETFAVTQAGSKHRAAR